MVLSYGIQPLPIEKALELYDILSEYLPEFTENTSVLDFAGTIIDNIVDAKSTAYVDALRLMTNMSLEEIIEFPTDIQIKIFITGLTENDIVSLDQFCKDIGYA